MASFQVFFFFFFTPSSRNQERDLVEMSLTFSNKPNGMARHARSSSLG